MKSLLKHIIVVILTWEAKMVLKKYKPKIIAVTGSVGKTSTKDAIFSVISNSVYARKSEKSFNSDIGVPLTILGCPNGWSNPLLWLKNILEGCMLIVLPNHYPKWLVLEIGADGPGDIRRVTEWVKPDVTVATRLSKVPVHVEFFASPEDVFEEKGYLVRALKLDGTLILNADDEDVLAFRSLVENKTILFGTGNGSDVFGSNYRISYENIDGESKPVGVTFDVTYGDETKEVFIEGALGIQQMYPALAAISVGIAIQIPFEKIISSLKNHHPSRGRMRILSGIKNSVIIDDSYNSSPVALHEALNTLEQIETKKRKIAVLGDMLELGTYSTEEHRKAGMKVGTFATILFTVGIRSRTIADGALDALMDEGNIFQYEESKSAAKDLALMIKEGDVILIKGSQGKRMERIVAEILADKTQKNKLLVRQDDEWLGR